MLRRRRGPVVIRERGAVWPLGTSLRRDAMKCTFVTTEPAPAKINLALHVRARRPDGYHEIETLFAFCRDGDR